MGDMKIDVMPGAEAFISTMDALRPEPEPNWRSMYEQLRQAAEKVFDAKGRYHTQLAMCELGELIGKKVTRP